jgi:polyprenyldihydroxybenzoate methyltransferase/3-demethylubiquinol 3-O-methyltransferase
MDWKEMIKFTKMGSDFFWKSNEGSALRSMNELRIPLIRDCVKQHVDADRFKRTIHPLAGVRILDIGSGGGLVAEPLARLGADVTGIDPVEENISTARQHLEDESTNLSSNLTYTHNSVEEYAAVDQNRNSFDAVVASEVLEHVDDVTLFLKSVHSLLKVDGKVIITTINQTPAAQLLAITVAENVLNLVPKGTHEYQKLVPLQGLILLLQETGFRIESVNGMAYNPFSNNWSWCKFRGINYAVVAVKQSE